MTETVKKFLSSGGCGDAFIVLSKLMTVPHVKIEWLHIESHDMKKMFDELCSYFQLTQFGIYPSFVHDPNYQQSFRSGRWSEYESVSTSIDGKCDLHGKTMNLSDPFVATNFIDKKKKYDIAIQCSGGISNNRTWRTNPVMLARLLHKKGYKVCIVGNAKIFETTDDFNFVNQLTLSETLNVIAQSKVFLGCSGLLTYFALACKCKTLHFEESSDHTKRYIHPMTEVFRVPLKFGSFPEIVKELSNLNYPL